MEQVRCSRRNVKGYGCQNRFVPEFRKLKGEWVPILRCPDCRRKHSVQMKKPKSKLVRKEWNQTPKGRAREQRANESDVGVANIARYRGSAKGKATKKQWNAQLIN